MDVPETVTAALEDVPVSGRTCLEAGAGVGNMTAGLLAAGAERVVAVTNDPEHARTVRERFEESSRLLVLEADVRSLPLATASIDVVTAHALCNVLPPAALDAAVTELTRVARPDGHLVVDDYDPVPSDAAVRSLFALENATAQTATGRPALSFYPARGLRRWFEGAGWQCQRERTVLEPVPWTRQHLQAHAAVVEEHAADVSEALGESFTDMAEDLVDEIGSESTGRMYSLWFARGEAADRDPSTRTS